MSTEIAPAPALERSWWLRAPVVLVAPRPIFASLRGESDRRSRRGGNLYAIATLAAISVVLVSPTFRRMLNDGSVSLVLIPVLAFVAGSLYAAAVFWLGGGLLYGASRRLGGEGTWRRARHVLALASAPLALSLLTFWPVRIAVYGQDLFRTGGDDYGRGDAIFGGIYLGLVAWSVWLLLIGVRSRTSEAAATIVLAAAFPVLIVPASRLGPRASNCARSPPGIAYVCCSSGNAPLHVLGVPPERADDRVAQFCVSLHEARCVTVRVPELSCHTTPGHRCPRRRRCRSSAPSACVAARATAAGTA